MKHWLILLSIAALTALGGLLPFTGADVAQLKPVELVLLSREGTILTVETDTGDRGTGADLKTAFEDLKATADGQIFLETVNDLLLDESALDLLPQIVESQIRPSTRVVQTRGEMNPETAVDFLTVHSPNTTLWDWKLAPGPLEVLEEREGRLYLGAD